jgi:iron-sulfur cluster assembly accessory protein
VFLDGSRIDFVTEGLKQMFKFDNPNVDSECGCGESFNVKKQNLDEINTEVTA